MASTRGRAEFRSVPEFSPDAGEGAAKRNSSSSPITCGHGCWRHGGAARFTKAVIAEELKAGRGGSRSLIVYGWVVVDPTSGNCTTAEEKSRAALSLLLASQQHEAPIDPAELQVPSMRATG
jgi:hypothetical protein